MNVLVVCDVLGEENNGTTIAAMNLIRYLRIQGENVRVLSCDKDKIGLKDYFVVPTRSFGFIIDPIIKKNQVTLANPKTKIIKEALKDIATSQAQNLTVDKIMDVVCKYYIVKKADLIGKKKNKIKVCWSSSISSFKITC